MSRIRFEATLNDGRVISTRSKTPLTHAWYAQTEHDGAPQERWGFAVDGETAIRQAENFLGNNMGRREIVPARRVSK